MLLVRNATERGRANFGWLDSRHTFSFGTYYDPRFMGFSHLRVINDDRVKPGAGFGEHGHRDMEIITIVLDGELEHRDSMGNGAVLGRGDVQMMSAGRGVRHSEFNHSSRFPLHFLQIWLEPNVHGGEPRYQQTHLEPETLREGWKRLIAPVGEDAPLTMQQDAAIWVHDLPAGKSTALPLREGRAGWLHVAYGELRLAGSALGAGDGVAIIPPEEEVMVDSLEDARLLFFDLEANGQWIRP